MKNLTEKIEVKSNKSARTFTIRKTYSDGSIMKYRTVPMTREEFDHEEMNTENDWRYFLRSTNDYYAV